MQGFLQGFFPQDLEADTINFTTAWWGLDHMKCSGFWILDAQMCGGVGITEAECALGAILEACTTGNGTFGGESGIERQGPHVRAYQSEDLVQSSLQNRLRVVSLRNNVSTDHLRHFWLTPKRAASARSTTSATTPAQDLVQHSAVLPYRAKLKNKW